MQQRPPPIRSFITRDEFDADQLVRHASENGDAA
jgi:hypothetical protein